MRTLLTIIAISFGLTGCVIAMPFKKGPDFGNTENNTAIVSLTYVVLGDDSELNSTFWSHVWKVQSSLKTQPGLIGYSLRKELLGDEGWTMTIWKDEESVNAFMKGEVHQTAMREGWPAVKKATFARETIAAEDIPLSWKKAEQLIEEKGRGY